MKFYIDEDIVFELSGTQKKVMKNDISSDIFDDDIKRRIKWVIEHKYKKCLKRLKDEWMPKLQDAGLESIPLDDEKLAELVFKQPDYKDRLKREKGKINK